MAFVHTALQGGGVPEVDGGKPPFATKRNPLHRALLVAQGRPALEGGAFPCQGK